MANHMKLALRDGKVVYGSWLAMGSPIAAEIMAHAGHDFLMIDGEHSPVSYETVLAMAQAMSATPCTPLMRVSSNDASKIKQALDVGIQGVIVPMVNNADDAHAAIQACRYPAQGTRGFASSRASLWGATMQEYVRTANEDTCAILQIEHPDAVENVEEILAVEGIDVAYVGVADLASFMGFTGQIGELDRSVDEAIEKVVAAAKKANVPLGIHCLTPQAAAIRIQQGFRYMAIGGDARYVGATARQQLQETKRLVE
jgi:2-keto-3-deoxy-L-rhamnonate aldolase RhmA